MRPAIVCVAAWGERHARIAEETVLRCLADQVGGDVELVMVTGDGDPPDPGNLSANRDYHAEAERTGLAMARSRGADWLPLCADHVVPLNYVEGCRAALDDFDVVVGTSVRARREPFLAEAGDLRLTPGQLLDLTMRHLHPQVFDYFVTEPPRHAPANPHHCFFAAPEGGFACRQLQPTLFAVRTSTFTDSVVHGPLDARLPAHCLDDGRGVLFVERLPNAISITGLDDEEVTTFGSFAVTPEEVAAFSRTLGIAPAHARWALGHRTLYPTPFAALPAGGLDEGAAMARILEGLG